MPIVLGNTTITGLGVGGLPNGVVNADDIASNSITPAKLTSNMTVKTTSYTSGYGVGARLVTSAQAWSGLNISGTSFDGPRLVGTPNIFRVDKVRSDTQLRIHVHGMPWYMSAGTSGFGLRIQYNTDGVGLGNYSVLEKVSEGIANGWGFGGYGGNAGVASWSIDTANSSAPSFFIPRTGAQYFYFQVYAWSGTTIHMIDYDGYEKYASWFIEEYIV